MQRFAPFFVLQDLREGSRGAAGKVLPHSLFGIFILLKLQREEHTVEGRILLGLLREHLVGCPSPRLFGYRGTQRVEDGLNIGAEFGVVGGHLPIERLPFREMLGYPFVILVIFIHSYQV